ncbi:STAS domain-containing protein [Fodinicola acaciae]|uniref:STAS domain-containing protein n=1 Tax=Fodinicola acaciae TaxID=2681555 RepID=UPI0013D7E32B|nr:STAS domain-containing protein [Fodinicola acaciae]
MIGRDPVPDAAFNVRVHRLDDAVLLSVVGEVDMLTAPTLADHIDQVDAGVAVVVLDLSLVAFFSSTAIAALIDGQRRLAEKGIGLRVVPSTVVRRALEIVGLGDTVPMYDEATHALAAAN